MVSFKEFLLMEEGDLDSKFSKINITGRPSDDEDLLNSVEDKIRGLYENENYTYEKILSKELLFKALIGIHLKYKNNAKIFRDKEYPFIKTTYYNQNREGKKINTIINTICKKYESSEDIINAINGNDFHKVIEASKNEIEAAEKKQQAEEDQKNYDEAIDKIKNAKSKDDIDKVQDCIDKIPEDKQEEIQDLINQKQKELDITDEDETEDDAETSKSENTQETPKKSEIVGANNVDYIAGSSLPVKELRNAIFDGDKKAAGAALDKWQEMVAKKIAELNEAKNNKVEQDSKYLKEEQEVLWEGILQNIKDKRDLKYKKVNEFKNIYDRDKSNDSTYEEKLKEIFDKASLKICDICENINNYSISNRKREEYKSRATTIINHLIDSTYSLLRNLKKNNSKEGFFNKRKIENAKEKERENEEYEKSFRGKDLNKKTSMFAQNFADIFVAAFKINQVKNIDDIAKRQILDLIAESDGNVQDFIRLVNKSRVMSPNDKEATMFAINWLNNKGLKVPGNISDNDIDLTERNPEIRGIKEAFELIKQKIGTEITPPYPDGVIANIVRRVEEIAKNNKNQTTRQNLINNLLASKENKEYPNEVKIISDKFGISLENKPQDEQISTNGQNVDNQNNNQDNPFESLKEQLRKMRDSSNGKITVTQINSLIDNTKGADKLTPEQKKELLNANDPNFTVTTKACDGLPIGARRYSRAIRRRMNYALNKYM